MALRKSIYSEDTKSTKCAICGADIFARTAIAKCHACAKKIAMKVAEEFEANKECYLTEAEARALDEFIKDNVK